MSDADKPRGIEPPTSPYGPPAPHDLGIDTKPARPSRRAVLDDAPEPVSGEQDMPLPSTSRPWAAVAIFAAIGVVLVLVLGLVVMGIGSVGGLIGDLRENAPSSESDDSAQSDPIPDPDPFDLSSPPGAVELSLQAKINEYKTARDNGSLWEKIPDSEYNRTAVSAFLYFLTDLKLAASFGADTSDYLEQANELELKLLRQEPLGSDILIKLSDRTFTYDGDTGEGGYTDN